MAFLCGALLCIFTTAEMSTLPGAQAIADLPGPPKNPAIFSQMTVIFQGDLQYEERLEVKGAVARIERQQTASQSQRVYHTRTTLNFDETGNLVTLITEDKLGVTTTTNVWVNGKLQSQTLTYHRNDGTTAKGTEWQRWSYDEDGRLSEFQAGQGKQEINDYKNFKYDPIGRPLGHEPDAETLTVISYEGNKITLSKLRKNPPRKFFEQVQIVDDQSRVVDLRVSDISGGQLKQWYHVAFKYDDKGRVVEQKTDPFKLGDGDDYSPIPGTLVVKYDDARQLGVQKFFNTDGKLVLHTMFEFDHDGIPTKLRVLDASGKERPREEMFGDAESHNMTTRLGYIEWEIVYDQHDNWTERRRWFTPADGSPRIMTRLVRQNITYR